MKRLVTRALGFLTVLELSLLAFATVTSAPALAQAPDFGTPPSGEIPILFNDQHVYAKPDRLKQNRVLAALVRGNTVLVPLRSMFEQTGATVSYDPATKTVDVSKPGADVRVTVGKPEVVINGETRPLDVPPEIYKGNLVVPLRVISEGMGAYVQWVAEKRLVVVRYVAQIAPTPPPATAPPLPPATPTPRPIVTPAPTLPPTPTPVATAGAQFFLVGDAIINPKVYNEFSPGYTGGVSGAGRAGVTFPFAGLALLAEADARQYRYPHRGAVGFDVGSNFPQNNIARGYNAPACAVSPAQGGAFGDPGCVTVIGGNGQVFVPSFDAKDTDIDGRLGVGLFYPKLFVVGSYLSRYGNYGYPAQNGFGIGLEKVADYDQTISPYGSVLYYPSVSGNYTDPFGTTFKLAYQVLKYQVGATLAPKGFPLFLDFGFLGDRGTNNTNAPGGYNHSGIYAGLGIHF